MATFTAIKSRANSGGGLRGAINYAVQKKKTLWEGRQLVSGWNCVPRCACDEMMLTKRQFGKTDGVQFYHFVQSFSPREEVTPQEVHTIGLELAQRLFPNFEVLVATHVDAGHPHNHLIVNSVSFLDGHKLHQNAADFQRQRQVSDELCAAHGLTVLAPAQKYTGQKTMRPGEYRCAAKGESWKFQLINTVDLCMRTARTREAFLAEMERRGYQVRWEANRKYITYTTPKGKKCRDDRLHDEKYKKEVMEYEFRIREAIVRGGIEGEESAGGSNGERGRFRLRPDPGAVESPVQTAGAADETDERAVQPAGIDGQINGEGHLGNADYADQGRDDGKGGRGDQPAARTGWEEEREEAFSTATVQADKSSPVYAQVVRGHGTGVGDIVGDLVWLGYRLEKIGGAAVRPAPLIGGSDRKTRALEREKKIAMGHNPDEKDEPQQGQTIS